MYRYPLHLLNNEFCYEMFLITLLLTTFNYFKDIDWVRP